MTVLETERLVLRKPVEADYPGFRDFFASDRSRYTGGRSEGVRGWLMFAGELGHWDLRGYGMFSVVDKTTEQSIGLVGPFFPPHWPEKEVGWLLWSEAEGKGIAYEAAGAVLEYVFNDLGWDTAVSYIDPENARSIKLAERLGAARDDDAERPDPEDLVYRHPRRVLQ